MRPEQMRTWLDKHKKQIAVIALGVGLILCVRLGTGGNSEVDHSSVETEPVLVSQAEVTETEPAIPVLDEDQIIVLNEIITKLEEGNLQEAAAGIFENEQKLQYIFYQVLDGKQYLYQDGKLSEELKGGGLVLKKPMSLFYGTYKEGQPEGRGIALQGIKLDGLRYDYSDGNWKAGMMEGAGTVGYYYYGEVQGEENQAVQKEGTFIADLIDGKFSYRTTNPGGETTTWEMEAESGKTKVDEHWIHEEEKQNFYLLSDQDSSHAYVLPESALEEIRWRNMLPWYE